MPSIAAEMTDADEAAPERILAMRFPASRDFHRALYRELDINYLVTKQSGAEGELYNKTRAARELNIEVLLVERPVLCYPEVYYSVPEVVERVVRARPGVPRTHIPKSIPPPARTPLKLKPNSIA